jgi:hypothetical protein
MATTTMTWTTYAILEPTKPQFNKKGEPVAWKVQRNGEGAWRCHCPSYIFSGKGGAVRTCKHIRRCQQQQQVEQVAQTFTPVPVAKAKPVYWDTAFSICADMLAKAQLYANEAQRDRLVTVLAAKLATFAPVKPGTGTMTTVKVTGQVVEVGVRRITFDD